MAKLPNKCPPSMQYPRPPASPAPPPPPKKSRTLFIPWAVPVMPSPRTHQLGAAADYFIMDFKEHPELHAALIERAAENFRTPGDEALAIIHEKLNNL